MAARAIDRSRTRNITGALWGGVLDRIDDARPASHDELTARLCLNWSNRVVQALADLVALSAGLDVDVVADDDR